MALKRKSFVVERIYNGTGLTTTITASIQAYLDKYQWAQKPTFMIKGTESGGTADVTPTIQSKVDGTNLVSSVSFTAMTGTSTEVKSGETLMCSAANPAQLTLTFSAGGGTWAFSLYMSGLVEGGQGS